VSAGNGARASASFHCGNEIARRHSAASGSGVDIRVVSKSIVELANPKTPYPDDFVIAISYLVHPFPTMIPPPLRRSTKGE
jgi:hypothetical protein